MGTDRVSGRYRQAQRRGQQDQREGADHRGGHPDHELLGVVLILEEEEEEEEET